MGLIKAAASAIGGSLADQWIDFYTVPRGLSQTAAIFPAVLNGLNSGRGSNVRSSQGVITNGSKIVVPEGYGLLTFQGGELTSLVLEPGAYTWNANDPESRSVFMAGDLAGMVSDFVDQSWQRFKYGGRPESQQLALFVSLKELPNNKFGTQTPIYWDDAYLNAQVGVTARGTFSLKIVDPILFVKNLLPASYLQNLGVFDFIDSDNQVSSQLFTELVACLSAAFSSYANDPTKSSRISNIQRDSVGFSESLSAAVEQAFRWTSERGISINRVAILGIDYDESTKDLLLTVQRADALTGSRGNSNLQASMASGLQQSGAVDGSAGILGLGIAATGLGVQSFHQSSSSLPPPPPPPTTSPPFAQNSASIGDDLVSRLAQLKAALESGLITQQEYAIARANALGL